MDKSVSVIVPAYNEEENLPLAVADLLSALKNYRPGFEIIIIDDGSTDETGKAAERLALENKQIRVVRHVRNSGFAATYLSGIRLAKKTWVVPFHGDNDSAAASLRLMVERIGEADIISAYTTNTQVRPLVRRIISKPYIFLMNALFGLSLRYYTGYFIARREMLAKLDLISSGLSVYTETKIRLLAAGQSMLEVPFVHTGRKYGRSKAVNFFTLFDVIRTTSALLAEFGFRKIKQTNKKS